MLHSSSAVANAGHRDDGSPRERSEMRNERRFDGHVKMSLDAGTLLNFLVQPYFGRTIPHQNAANGA